MSKTDDWTWITDSAGLDQLGKTIADADWVAIDTNQFSLCLSEQIVLFR